MASRPRDLTFRFLSDTDRFDLTDPARALDDLGDEARDTGRRLDELGDADPRLDRLEQDTRDAGRRLDDLGDQATTTGRRLENLGDDAKAGGRRLDDLGDQAKATAGRVDDAFDAIAKSSRANMRKVDADLDRAGEGLDEFKDESRDSAREAAASFSGGFDDIADLVQETAANAFAGFGPLGAAAGMAGAAGIGFLVNTLTEAKERAQELARTIIDMRLDPSFDSAPNKIQAFLDSLKDDGDLNRFRLAAQAAGVNFSDWVRAMALGGPELEAMRARLAGLNNAGGGFEATMTAAGRATNDLRNRTIDQVAAFAEADGSVTAYQEGLGDLVAREEAAQQAAEDHQAAVSSLGDTLDQFADPASTYAQLLADKEQKERDTAQATADATRSQSDSWEDYVKAADVSVDEYLDALDRQVQAQEQWGTNLATLAKRGVEEGVLEQLARMGPEGAPLVAKLTSASDAELARLVDLYDRQGKAAGDRVAAGIIDAKPRVVAGAEQLRAEVRDRLAGTPVTIPTNISAPAWSAASTVRSTIAAMIGTVRVPIMLSNVPQSIWVQPRSTP